MRGAWRTSPLVWGGLLVLGAALVVVGVYATVDRRDVWVWDAVKAFTVAFVALSAGIGLRRRSTERS